MRHIIPRTTVALLFIFGLVSAPPAVGQVRINEVDYEDQWVELFNEGSSTVDVSGYYLCTFPTYQSISSLTIISGSTSLGAGEFLVVEWTASNFSTSDGEVGLYLNGNDFGNPANMADYMEYGSAGHAREDEAVTAGEWDTGEFVDLAPSGKTVSFFDAPGEVGAEDWGASNETQGGPNQVLPVELTSFDAVVDQQHVHLTWRTASETSNAGFEVQRKGEDTFQRIGFVEGHGTTNAPQTYRFTARDVESGTHTFRLKQIDFDGAFEYSPEVEVTIAMEEAFALSAIHPNPARGEAAFSLTVRQTQPVTVTLYDVLGRRVSTIFEGTIAAGRTRQFDIRNQSLADGLYLVRAVGARFSATRRVTLLK